MMHILQTGIVLVLFFAVLVVFHELGHFLAAKACKMKVEEFALGFGPRVVRIGFDGETEYNLRAFPGGGFVRIAGMESETVAEAKLTGAATDTLESDDPGARIESTNEHLLHQESQEVSQANPDGFNSRPLFQRFLVIFAGPVFSILLGWLVLCLVGVLIGFPLFRIENVLPNSVASHAGLKSGDSILAIDDREVDFGTAMDTINASIGKPLRLTIRDASGANRMVTVVPASNKMKGDLVPVGRIGITSSDSTLTCRRVDVATSFSRGTEMAGNWFSTMAALCRTGAIKDSVGGPIAIAQQTGEATKRGPFDLLLELGTLSLSLGIVNLLPIPVFDGGHIMLMFVELIRRRKLTADQTFKVTMAGVVIIVCLVLVIFVHDIIGLIHHG